MIGSPPAPWRGKKVQIRYHSLNQNRHFSREIDPYAVYFDPDGATLKLLAFDPLHGEIRVFAVEVSLDIDYGRSYSEPAPADALGQRLGRINRSGSRKDENNVPKPSQVVIFAEPSNGYLYDETLTNRTIELLRQVDALTEAELTEIIDKVYQSGYPPDAKADFEKGLNNEDVLKFAERIVAGTHRP